MFVEKAGAPDVYMGRGNLAPVVVKRIKPSLHLTHSVHVSCMELMAPMVQSMTKMLQMKQPYHLTQRMTERPIASTLESSLSVAWMGQHIRCQNPWMFACLVQ